MAVMLLPTIWYALQMERMEFPVTERVANKVSDSEMYKALLNPLYIIITIAMLGTATSELFINQYVDVLLKSVSDNAILILLITSGVMTFGRVSLLRLWSVSQQQGCCSLALCSPPSVYT